MEHRRSLTAFVLSRWQQMYPNFIRMRIYGPKSVDILYIDVHVLLYRVPITEIRIERLNYI